MNWIKGLSRFWDIGEETIISLTEKNLARVLRALIQCEAKVHDTHCLEKKVGSTALRYPTKSCSVVIRISLPVGAEQDFEAISGHKLSKPPRVSC